MHACTLASARALRDEDDAVVEAAAVAVVFAADDFADDFAAVFAFPVDVAGVAVESVTTAPEITTAEAEALVFAGDTWGAGAAAVAVVSSGPTTEASLATDARGEVGLAIGAAGRGDGRSRNGAAAIVFALVVEVEEEGARWARDRVAAATTSALQRPSRPIRPSCCCFRCCCGGALLALLLKLVSAVLSVPVSGGAPSRNVSVT